MSEISKDYARKLAHDLKAPLSALKILEDMNQESDQKDLLKASIERYEAIIKELEEQY